MIRIGREIQFLPYAGFFSVPASIKILVIREAIIQEMLLRLSKVPLTIGHQCSEVSLTHVKAKLKVTLDFYNRL